MRRLFTTMTALLAAMLLLSACSQRVSQAEYIGIDAAKALALESAGVSASQAQFSTAGLDKRNGLDYYAVDFSANGQQYQFDIDAITGVIIESQSSAASEGVINSASGSGAATASGNTASSAPASGNQDTIPQNGGAQNLLNQTPTQSPADDTRITADQAKAAALAHAGLDESAVTFVKAVPDYDDGRQVYDVEFYGGDYTEYDYEIDAVTGQVLSFDYDAEYYTPPASPSTNTVSGEITADEAKTLALSQVPGATLDDIYEFEVDYDDGRLEYEGKINYNAVEYEFEIDGYSGAIRSWDAESIYD